MSVYMNKCAYYVCVCVCVCKCIFNTRTYVHIYIYIYILCVYVRVCLCMCIYIYIQYIIKPHFQTCPCEIWVLWFACCERTFLWRLSAAALDTGRHTGVCLNRTDADVSGRKCLAGDVARPSIAIRSWIWKRLKIAPGNNLQIWKW